MCLGEEILPFTHRWGASVIWRRISVSSFGFKNHRAVKTSDEYHVVINERSIIPRDMPRDSGGIGCQEILDY